MLSGTPNSSVWEQIRLWERKSDRSRPASVASSFRRLPQQDGSIARRFHRASPRGNPRTRGAERFGKKYSVARDSSSAPPEGGNGARQPLIQGRGLNRKDRNRDEIPTRPRNEYCAAESVVLSQPGPAYRLATQRSLARSRWRNARRMCRHNSRRAGECQPTERQRLSAQLNRELGMGILYISHDLLSVAALCHRIAILNDGEIVEIGPPPQIFGAPRHPYTQKLIAALPRVPFFDSDCDKLGSAAGSDD